MRLLEAWQSEAQRRCREREYSCEGGWKQRWWRAMMHAVRVPWLRHVDVPRGCLQGCWSVHALRTRRVCEPWWGSYRHHCRPLLMV